MAWRPVHRRLAGLATLFICSPPLSHHNLSAGKSLAYDDIMRLGGGAVHITTGGYEFLLKDTSLQVRRERTE